MLKKIFIALTVVIVSLVGLNCSTSYDFILNNVEAGSASDYPALLKRLQGNWIAINGTGHSFVGETIDGGRINSIYTKVSNKPGYGTRIGMEYQDTFGYGNVDAKIEPDGSMVLLGVNLVYIKCEFSDRSACVYLGNSYDENNTTYLVDEHTLIRNGIKPKKYSVFVRAEDASGSKYYNYTFTQNFKDNSIWEYKRVIFGDTTTDLASVKWQRVSNSKLANDILYVITH